MKNFLCLLLTCTLVACVSSRTEGADPPGRVFSDCAVACPSLVVIPSGSFEIGSPAHEPGRQDAEGPRRSVRVRAFALGRDDVTVGEWSAFVTATRRPTTGGCSWASASGSKPDPAAAWNHVDFPQTDAHPVVCVTWADARAYAAWMSTRTGHRYRLPTESEWEYAARAGTATAYPWGEVASHDQANYGNEACCSGLASGRDAWVSTSPVGSFPPNAFGLRDMHGNVMQWVQDCLSVDYAELPDDGAPFERSRPLPESRFLLRGMAGADSCAYRMLRGGDWGDPPRMIRSAFRNYAPPRGSSIDDYKSGGAGFRVVRELD